MNITKKSSLTILILTVFLFFTLLFPTAAHANAAEPPMLIILVENPPSDLELSISFAELPADQPIELRKQTQGWEAYYRLFMHNIPQDIYNNDDPIDGAFIEVESELDSYSVQIPDGTLSMYNNLLTLDFESGLITEGQPPLRVPTLVALRVLLTLIVEGAVLYLFGYREKKSFAIFLAINLITQTLLNLSFSGSFHGYFIFAYIFGEIFVFLSEMAVFGLFVKEHGRKRAILYAFIANLASLIAGYLVLSYMPI